MTQDAALRETIEGKYKYGFVTDVETDQVPKGLSEEIIRTISSKKGEPEWMLEWRLKAYRHWLEMVEPTWPNVHYPRIDYQEIVYYSAPKPKKKLGSIDEVDPELKQAFEKLGIPLEEQKMMPFSASFPLKVVATDTESNTASTATLASRACSASGIPSFSKARLSSGSTSSIEPSFFFGLGAE